MISICNLSYYYKRSKPVLDEVSLKISTGICGLLGENGSGNSFIHKLMGRFFNIQRFVLLERYKARETGIHCLMVALFTCCVYWVNFFSDLNDGLSQPTRGGFVFLWVILMISISPCLLERGIHKRNSVFDLLLPASVFEKFFHIWAKYLVLMPWRGTDSYQWCSGYPRRGGGTACTGYYSGRVY